MIITYSEEKYFFARIGDGSENRRELEKSFTKRI